MQRSEDHPLFIKCYVTGVYQENTWFIRDRESGRAALVDPGDSIDQLVLADGVLEGGEIDEILLTHAHMDHVWGLSAAKAQWPDATIRMHRDDLELLRSLPRQGAMIGMPMELPPAPEPDQFVAEGESFDFGGQRVEVLHTPGHSEGGVCYLFDTGDCFLGDMIIAGSIGRTDLPGGNREKMLASLQRLMALDPQTWIYGGHGPPSCLADELRNNAVLGQIEHLLG